MKRILAVALCTIFVLGMAAMAFADVSITGDMRVRGISKTDYDFNETAKDKNAYYDQRLRMNFEAKKGDVSVFTRATFSEGVWGKNALYGSVALHDDDYAYMVFPALGGKFTVGRQLADWGNKFLVWNSGRDRIKYGTKLGEFTTGFMLDKVTESSATVNTQDSDNYVLYGVGKISDHSIGLLYIHNIDRTAASRAKNSGDPVAADILDFFANGKAGAFVYAAEFAYKGGDAYDKTINATRDGEQIGAFVQLGISFDAFSMPVALAWADNGYVADKYFTPTVFFGLSQPTAMADFGSEVDGTTFAVVVGAEFKVASASKMGVRFAEVIWDSAAVNGSFTLTEFDVTFNHQISEGTTYYIDFGYLIPDWDDTTKTDDPAMALAHKVEVKF